MRLKLFDSRSATWLLVTLSAAVLPSAAGVDPSSNAAVRVVRFRIAYPDADTAAATHTPNWGVIMRKSVLASLRFVNKHWLICDDAPEPEKVSGPDCGRLQVTGEEMAGGRGYRINATFIANGDPIRNAKVDGATSTVLGVMQIGLRGGIFQYTNAMKALGKPSPNIEFEEAFFCFPGFRLVDGQRCERADALASPATVAAARHAHHRARKHRRDASRRITVGEPARFKRRLTSFS